MDWRTLFLTAQGRIGQKDFWIGFLVLFVAGFVLGIIPVIGQIIGLLLIYPNVCLMAKRLHDFGKSGWLAAIPYGASALFAVFAIIAGMGAMAASVGGSDAAAVGALGAMGLIGGLGLLLFVVMIGFVLWVGLTKGDPAPNLYGPPPMALVTAV